MKKYDSYKDSGIEWIGVIPSHWKIMPLKYCFNIVSGATPKTERNEFWDGEIIWITPADYKTEDHYIENGNRNITFQGLNSCGAEIVPKGSLIFSKRAPIGTISIANTDLCTNQGCLSCVPKDENESNFFYYLLTQPIKELEILGSGATFLEISTTNFSNFDIPVPPLSEQKEIADYLDRKCSEIDAAVAKVDKELELLDELKQSEISKAVTKGLNPNVSFKPSGIYWIGEIPSHWNISRMRYLCNIITGDKDTINKVDDGLYPFYVRSPQIEKINSYTFDGEAVLMAGDGVGAGKVIHYVNGKFDFHQRVYNFHNFKNIKGRFLFYYIQSLFKFKIEEGGAKNTVDSVRQPWLKDFPICLPSLKEQEGILCWLDRKCGEIDSLKEKLKQKKEKLQELRQSLISQVVTGKRKVI